MPGNKNDRRVRYTRMVLRESFIELLSQKDISQISIKELCERADINRATFYSHYTDQYDLMQKIEAELFDNISEYLADFPPTDKALLPVDIVEKIFLYIRDNASLCRLLLSERGNLNFQKKIMNVVYDKKFMAFARLDSLPSENTGYVDAFIITGCIGMIQKWLDDDMRQSAREMAELMLRMTECISRGFALQK